MDIRKTEAEIGELMAETMKLHAEASKLRAEASKLERESRWMPLMYATGLITVAIAVVKLLD